MDAAIDPGNLESAEEILYPKAEPYNQGYMKTADGVHELYFEEYGNPDGVPIVYLHGGPGAGNTPLHHRFFDPDHFRIVNYEQRGAPLSRPRAGAENNSPKHLVDDNDNLREMLGIEAWHVSGGSWGSTLAMGYAQKYPKQTLSLTLRGVWLMRAHEIDHFMFIMGRSFPEAHKAFLDFLPARERKDPLKGYYKRVMNKNPAIHEPAAEAFVAYETACSFLRPLGGFTADETTLSFARMEALFMFKYCNQLRLKENLKKIKNIPTQIVHGRYDVVCPPQSAFEVAEALNDCRLDFTFAGHSASELENTRLLVASANAIRDTGSPIIPG